MAEIIHGGIISFDVETNAEKAEKELDHAARDRKTIIDVDINVKRAELAKVNKQLEAIDKKQDKLKKKNQTVQDRQNYMNLVNERRDLETAQRMLSNEIKDYEKQMIVTQEQSAKQIEKTANAKVLAAEDINKQLEQEKKNLQEIRRLQNENDRKRETFKSKRDNYSGYLGDNKAVYDTGKMQIARNYLKQIDVANLKTKKEAQAEYVKMRKVIEDAYLGQYGIENGLYKDIDDFISSSPELKRLEQVFSQGSKSRFTKQAQSDMNTVINGMKSSLSSLESLGSDVWKFPVIERLDAEEIELGREQQKLYDQEQEKLNVIAKLNERILQSEENQE